jgi:hypothetical protein
MVPTLCEYLVESIRAFPKQAEVKDMMRTAGHTPSHRPLPAVIICFGRRLMLTMHRTPAFPSAMSGDTG